MVLHDSTEEHRTICKKHAVRNYDDSIFVDRSSTPSATSSRATVTPRSTASPVTRSPTPATTTAVAAETDKRKSRKRGTSDVGIMAAILIVIAMICTLGAAIFHRHRLLLAWRNRHSVRLSEEMDCGEGDDDEPATSSNGMQSVA